MSVRARLALSSAVVAAIVLILICATAYVFHVRGQYDDLDHSLVITAQHFQEEAGAAGAANEPGAFAAPGPNILAQVYNSDQSPLGGSTRSSRSAPLTPLQVLNQNAGPAYDRLLRWVPGGARFDAGAFATTDDPSSGARVRSYALSLDSGRSGYVLTWASLAQLDDSTRFLRWVLLGVVIGGTLVAAGGSFVVAGRALRPVSTMTQTARAIAASRGFSRRLEEPERSDELGRLARTFNEMLASLEEAYRLQQRFVADAAHELRAPLTGILGNLDLLAKADGMPPDERAEALSYADAEARRLSRIVSELLTLARADAGQTLELRRVELDRVLLDAVAEVRAQAEGRPIELTRFEPLVVNGDPDRLKQLVLNLIDNALKYTPYDRGISLELGAIEGEAVLKLEDRGIGISSDELPHLFERFYRADPARSRDPGGTGLGLAIVKWIVEQHHGDISIESAIGVGTTVTVRLPLAASAGSKALAEGPGLQTTR